MKTINDLKENPLNPRKITDKKAEALALSLRLFGDLGCIVYNRRTDRLVSGHQRVRAMAENTEIVYTYVYQSPKEDGTVAEGTIWLGACPFKYREVDWPEDKELTAMLAANEQGGRWDFTKLPDVLLKIDEFNIDLKLTGFDKKQAEDILAPIKDLKEQCPRCGK